VPSDFAADWRHETLCHSGHSLRETEKEGIPFASGLSALATWATDRCTAPQATPWNTLVAVANRTLSKAEKALRDGGRSHFQTVNSLAQLSMNVIAKGDVCLTGDPLLLCDASNIDVNH